MRAFAGFAVARGAVLAVTLVTGGAVVVVACGSETAALDRGLTNAPDARAPLDATTAADADLDDAGPVVADGDDATTADDALDGTGSMLDGADAQAPVEAGDGASSDAQGESVLDAAGETDGSVESSVETPNDASADVVTESPTDAAPDALDAPDAPDAADAPDAPASCGNVAGQYLLNETESVESACPLDNCGYGAYEACGITSLGTATLPSAGMIHWTTSVPGIIDGFTGPIETNGHFECTSDNLGAEMLWIGDIDANCHVTATVSLAYGGCMATISEEGSHR